MNISKLPVRIIIDISAYTKPLTEEIANLAGEVNGIDEVLNHLFDFCKHRFGSTEVYTFLAEMYGIFLVDDGLKLSGISMELIDYLRNRLEDMHAVEVNETFPYHYEKSFATNSILLIREDLTLRPEYQALVPFDL